MNNKIERGQFYTKGNPFKHKLFYEWYNLIDNIEDKVIIEPFGGSNNIVRMISDMDIEQPKSWRSFDIEPPTYNSYPSCKVEERDTLSNFPKGYSVCITNPPYLAKNSATRQGLKFPDTKYDNLYKISLRRMLDNLDYIAAIIPESFITQDKFKDRLYGVISLDNLLFEDTSTPVCLALFTPEYQDDYIIYIGDYCLGFNSEIKGKLEIFELNNNIDVIRWRFNDPNGNIGVNLIDSTFEDDVYFTLGSNIDSCRIKETSRAITRISGLDISGIELIYFINECNDLLYKYRYITNDISMTSYRGLRDDGVYRRRLSFKQARMIMNKAYENIYC